MCVPAKHDLAPLAAREDRTVDPCISAKLYAAVDDQDAAREIRVPADCDVGAIARIEEKDVLRRHSFQNDRAISGELNVARDIEDKDLVRLTPDRQPAISGEREIALYGNKIVGAIASEGTSPKIFQRLRGRAIALRCDSF